MNVERWLKARNPSWQRLEELLKIVDGGGLSKLDHLQLRELGRLYRATSADLSRCRAMNLGQNVQTYLNNLVVKAHNQVYQTKANRWSDLINFLWYGFPQLVRRYILYVGVSFMMFLVPFGMSFYYVQQDSHFAQLEVMKGHPIVPDELWDIIEKHGLWTDSVQHYSATAAGLIATNNIRVSIMAFVLGITFGTGTVFVLFTNGLMIGTILGLCRTYGLMERLGAFVAPHGVLELSAIFISGAAGLLIGKSMLFPGLYKRTDAMRMIAKDACGLFMGCVPLLLLAGTIEGFISPRTDISSNVKILVSLATLSFLVFYLFEPRTRKGERMVLEINEPAIDENVGAGAIES
jgi:uncharacterized membrane protein SpoIIM required for sporulation